MTPEELDQRLKATYSLEGVNAVLYDRFGVQGLHVGKFTGGSADHHEKHVSGYVLVERIAWAERRLTALKEARDNLLALLAGCQERYRIIDWHTGETDMVVEAESTEDALRRHNAMRWPDTATPDTDRYYSARIIE